MTGCCDRGGRVTTEEGATMVGESCVVTRRTMSRQGTVVPSWGDLGEEGHGRIRETLSRWDRPCRDGGGLFPEEEGCVATEEAIHAMSRQGRAAPRWDGRARCPHRPPPCPTPSPGTAPRDSSFLVNVLMVHHYQRGAWYPRGGGQRGGLPRHPPHRAGGGGRAGARPRHPHPRQRGRRRRG